MSFSISGKTAIVTGAANGIGLSIARHFAAAGANVMAADMDEARLAEEIGTSDSDDGNMRYFAGDLRERLTTANLLSATIGAFERVDILVNASRQVLTTNPLSVEDDSVDVMLQQNLMASFRLSQLISKRMIKQAEKSDEDTADVGAIVNLSSITAERARPELLAYSISSAAMNQMTRTMALALAPHKIRVNAIAIGSVMSASLKSSLAEAGPDLREEIEAHTPLQEIAGPGEVAEAAHFLASDAARFVTGQILTLDGGRSLPDPVSSPAH